MSTTEFRKLLQLHLKPRLNQLGFMGSDHHFRKNSDEHFIYTLVIQGNRYGGSCCMELGVHLDFLPIGLNGKADIHNLTVYDCEFRERIEAGFPWAQRIFARQPQARWFEYGESEADAIRTINRMYKVFKVRGLEYFDQFKGFPGPILSITLEHLKAERSKQRISMGAPQNLRLALVIARTHEFVGDLDSSLKFAEWGLNHLGQATGLKPHFEELISRITQTKGSL
ncbi:DUF4304 domain-containing protein [Paenibacillus pedocola]|uniref:DUF4304 domain-containing protein n=1 Tax=Paenibacillus pedocola TaxID=3242193 RepID=UPI0028775356|nr:DUF4304 domain-containing protein [Paenibacillus typhae]